MNKLFDAVQPYSQLAGRVLLAAIFVLAGYGKISAYAGTQAYMASAGVPGGLLPQVILLELGGGLAIVLGVFTRLVALLLAGFSIIAGLLFHGGADQMQQIMLLKDVSIAGGFLLLVANGAGRLSIDGLRSKR